MGRTRNGIQAEPLYGTWHNIKTRCFNPNNKLFKYYGARGITMCDKWRYSFAAFAADMGPRPSSKHNIDRIDNDGPYSPENCRWVTQAEQNRNRRNNLYATLNGETRVLKDWAPIVGVNYYTLRMRIYRDGWSTEKALTTPARKGNYRRKSA